MEEYVFKTATMEEWQKWLNQWRHKYTLKILHVSHGDQTTIYLKRTPI